MSMAGLFTNYLNLEGKRSDQPRRFDAIGVEVVEDEGETTLLISFRDGSSSEVYIGSDPDGERVRFYADVFREGEILTQQQP